MKSKSTPKKKITPNPQEFIEALEKALVPDDLYDAWLSTLTKEELKALEARLLGDVG
jgi:hypothetical protein